MGFIIAAFIVFAAVVIILPVVLFRCLKYNRYGFDKNGVHQNGTRYDDFGYDWAGLDIHGYNRSGYNIEGRNREGQYNRIFDMADYSVSNYSKDGFLNPNCFPVKVSKHATERICERMPGKKLGDVRNIAYEAYCYGKSKRQIKKSAAALMDSIESRHENGVLLVHRGYIYIFSHDNELITVYKNDRIPL